MTRRVRCGEHGCSEAERWSDRFAPRPEDRDRLANLVAGGLLDMRQEGGDFVRVAGKDHCGRLRLPSGAYIDITSKIPALRLLEWLAFTDRLPVFDEWADHASIGPGGTVVDAFVAMFIGELVRLTQFHWRPGYAVASQQASTFRGRLDTGRLGVAAARLPSLPCRVRTRTMDTLANRVLARALDVAMRMSTEKTLPEARRRQLEWLVRQWSDISRAVPDLDHALSQTVGCPPIGYRRALRLARLLLRGGVIDPMHGDGGDLFVVNMSSTWEEGLRRMLEPWAHDRGLATPRAEDRTRPWLDEHGAAPSRRLEADAIIVADRPLVFDAKYKRGYADESRSDRFQMAAYAMAFGARAAVLVYPTAVEVPRQHLLLEAALPGARSSILSMELPMALGPQKCAVAAAEAMQALMMALP